MEWLSRSISFRKLANLWLIAFRKLLDGHNLEKIPSSKWEKMSQRVEQRCDQNSFFKQRIIWANILSELYRMSFALTKLSERDFCFTGLLQSETMSAVGGRCWWRQIFITGLRRQCRNLCESELPPKSKLLSCSRAVVVQWEQNCFSIKKSTVRDPGMYGQ